MSDQPGGGGGGDAAVIALSAWMLLTIMQEIRVVGSVAAVKLVKISLRKSHPMRNSPSLFAYLHWFGIIHNNFAAFNTDLKKGWIW